MAIVHYQYENEFEFYFYRRRPCCSPSDAPCILKTTVKTSHNETGEIIIDFRSKTRSARRGGPVLDDAGQREKRRKENQRCHARTCAFLDAPDNKAVLYVCVKCEKGFHLRCLTNILWPKYYSEIICQECEGEHGGPPMVTRTNNFLRDCFASVDHFSPTATPEIGSPAFVQTLTWPRNTQKTPWHWKTLKPCEFSQRFIEANGFDHPFIFPESSGLGFIIPRDLSYEKVLDDLGCFRLVQAIDVCSQKEISVTVGKVIRCLMKPPGERQIVVNVLSLEVTGTKLGDAIKAPDVVKNLSWVDLFWNQRHPRQQISVSKYCILSMENSYTDFHIDFGGSSVWYHVVKGRKVFFLIRPTDENLEKYKQFHKLRRTIRWLFDDIGEQDKFEIALTDGQTFFLPGGWIHAVWTPKDSIVIGGNFLHFFSAVIQERIVALEKEANVLEKFRFPQYDLIRKEALLYLRTTYPDAAPDQQDDWLISAKAALTQNLG